MSMAAYIGSEPNSGQAAGFITQCVQLIRHADGRGLADAEVVYACGDATSADKYCPPWSVVMRAEFSMA